MYPNPLKQYASACLTRRNLPADLKVIPSIYPINGSLKNLSILLFYLFTSRGILSRSYKPVFYKIFNFFPALRFENNDPVHKF